MGMLLVTLMVMLIVVVGMSVGVLFGRKPLAGSCGGVGQALGEKDYVCDLCGNDEDKCKEIQADAGSGGGMGSSASAISEQDLAYDASKGSPSTQK